jgi:hypothetical protein
VVFMPPGVYLIGAASLTIPRGVSLEGPGIDVGTRWSGGSWVHGKGAVLAITVNPATKNEDNAAIRMTTGSRLEGFGIYYPNQPVTGGGAVVAYPPTVGLVADPQGNLGNVSRPAIKNLYVTNAFVFVSWTKRHDLGLIEDVYGTAIKLDQAYDVDRLIRVHSNPNAAYVGAWPGSQTVLDRQHGQTDGQFIRLGKTDQAYLFNTFGFGFRRGLNLVDDGFGGSNGLQVMQSGFEGTPNPMVIVSGSGLFFSQLVLGDSSDLPGYGTGPAVLITPAAGAFLESLYFDQVKVFAATGPAFAVTRVRGFTVVNSILERVRSAGGFLRGLFEINNAARVTVDGNQIQVRGDQIIMATFDNVRGFNVRDNFYDGQPNNGVSPMAISGSSAGRVTGNLEVNSSGSTRVPYVASSTDVAVENFRNYAL